jgi:hypothetical protein
LVLVVLLLPQMVAMAGMTSNKAATMTMIDDDYQ